MKAKSISVDKNV